MDSFFIDSLLRGTLSLDYAIKKLARERRRRSRTRQLIPFASSQMLYTFIRFRHAADIAWLTMRLYDSREPDDLITEARIGFTLEAVLYFQHLDGGITIGPDLIAQEAMPDVAVHERVFLVFDTLMGMPALMLESITMSIPRTGQIHIKKATAHTDMLCKIVNAVFVNEWPPNMTKDDQLAAAVMDMSMEHEDRFNDKAPTGFEGNAAWLVYEAPMMVHAFICWALTVYLAEMRDFGDWSAVQEYVKPFITDCSSPFCFSAGVPYFPIRDKLMQVQADCCDVVDLVTREAHLPSLYALLVHHMQVPKLGDETLPEFTDEPPMGLGVSPVAQQPLSPLGDLLITDILEFFPTPVQQTKPVTTPVRPRRLFPDA